MTDSDGSGQTIHPLPCESLSAHGRVVTGRTHRFQFPGKRRGNNVKDFPVLRGQFCFRMPGAAAPIPRFAKLLLAVLVLGVSVQAQSNPGAPDRRCPPGTACPGPQEPARTVGPDTIIDNRPRTDTERPKERPREENLPPRRR